MITHCEINDKKDLILKNGQKPYKVEFIYRGYWAKWYAGYDVQDVINTFKTENPDKTYCRTKKH